MQEETRKKSHCEGEETAAAPGPQNLSDPGRRAWAVPKGPEMLPKRQRWEVYFEEDASDFILHDP